MRWLLCLILLPVLCVAQPSFVSRRAALIAAQAVPVAAGSSTLNTGIIAYYKLDEASGNATDSVGANTLTDNNTVTSAAGKVGTARQFTLANSESFSRASTSDLATGDIDFTVAAWVYLDSVGANRPIVQKGWDDAYGEYLLYYSDGPGKFQFSIANGAATIENSSSSVLSISTWYFVVASYDAAANQLRISVNNGTVDTASYSGGNTTTTGNFKIGAGIGTFMSGRIDEVGFWKKVLSAAEITEIYNGGSGKTYPF